MNFLNLVEVIMDLQVILAVGMLTVSAGVAWGVATSKLRTHEIRLAVVESEHKTDHDILIEIRTKLDMLLQQASFHP
jgi:hypothetical protein